MPATAHKKLDPIVQDLRRGALVIFPTETVYGLGANVFDRSAVARIYRLKGRAWRKPLALLVPALALAAPLLETIPPEALRVAKKFCPGPLTLVLKASPLGQMVMGGLKTIGVRIPDHPLALTLLKKFGMPLATTSVNRSGQAPATTFTACWKLFGKQVDHLLDGGPCRIKEPSSVVDFSHYPFTVIREGALPRKHLEKALL